MLKMVIKCIDLLKNNYYIYVKIVIIYVYKKGLIHLYFYFQSFLMSCILSLVFQL